MRTAGLLHSILSGEQVTSWKCLTQSTPREGGVRFLAASASLCSPRGQKAVLQGSTAAQALPGAPTCVRAGVRSRGVGRQPFRADSSPAAPLGSRHMPLPAR